MKDAKTWKEFSRYIRLRDSNGGYCKCITCGLIRHWKQMDCGHGISRQHWGTRYDERNNAAQCKKCNGFEGGRREIYKIKVDEKYGDGTWDLLEVKSKSGKRPSAFELEIMRLHYKRLADELENQ